MQLIRLGVMILAITVIAGCDTGQDSTLEGRAFVSTSVVDDGAPLALVPGTQVRLSFADGQISASAGCNSIGGAYRVEDDVLAFDGGSMTEMGCDPDRHAQDEWLVAFLASRPTAVLDGAELELTSGGTAIALIDREVAEPDLPLVGTRWTVDTIMSGDAASSLPEGAVATFEFTNEGRVEVSTGCNTGSGSYEATDGAVRFTNVAITEMACAGAAGTLEAAILPILAAETVDYTIDAARLTLQAGSDGLGLAGS